MSICLPRGATCLLVGPNGAGKTTLLKVLLPAGRGHRGPQGIAGFAQQLCPTLLLLAHRPPGWVQCSVAQGRGREATNRGKKS